MNNSYIFYLCNRYENFFHSGYMAGTKGSKYYDVFLKYRIWLEDIKEQDIVGYGKFELLYAIQTENSLVRAARKTKISYRKAWGIVREMEQQLGFQLVKKKRGGLHGGWTVLTDDGENLMKAYDELMGELDIAFHDIAKRFFKKINQ